MWLDLPLNSIRRGTEIWKKTWLTEIIIVIMIVFISLFLLAPLGMLTGAVARSSQLPQTPPMTLDDVVGLIIANPTFFAIACITAIAVTIILVVIVGGTQKVANEYAGQTAARIQDILKGIIPDLIPLAIVGMVMFFVFSVPLIIIGLIFQPYTFSQPIAQSVTIATVLSSINIHTTLEVILMTLSVIVLAGPFFLGVSSIVTKDATTNGIVEGWKLYTRMLVPTIITVTIMVGICYALVVVIATIELFMVFLAPPEGATAVLPLGMILTFVEFVIVVVAVFLVIPWMITVMYAFYKALKT